MAQDLSWIRMLSGQFFVDHIDRFNRRYRANHMLLENLKYLRQHLINELGLDYDICHDLLARVIFIQFLFHRKDSDGNPALNERLLHRLQLNGVLSSKYQSLAEILHNYDDSYALFEWLNSKFNGDLFPGKGATEEDRRKEWQSEKRNVRPEHLLVLANFVSGEMRMDDGQRCLWPLYAFDAIPLEFISSIYEVFVKKRGKGTGVYYTPGHVVDFMLDGVLPWESEKWDLRILDPACGSGIFLVKAYQRLIHRWKRANPN